MRISPLLPLAAALALAPAPAPRAAAGDNVTIYRCVGAKGAVSLQDKPCAKGTEGTAREMVRPKDAPPRPVRDEPELVLEPDMDREVEYVPLRLPPPPLYVCTTYDGEERETESYQPNRRCEPVVLYHPEPERLPRNYQRACTWVQDSCVRLSDAEACRRWRERRKEAASDALHATRRTEPYLDSELERITDIVREHCS